MFICSNTLYKIHILILVVIAFIQCKFVYPEFTHGLYSLSLVGLKPGLHILPNYLPYSCQLLLTTRVARIFSDNGWLACEVELSSTLLASRRLVQN